MYYLILPIINIPAPPLKITQLRPCQEDRLNLLSKNFNARKANLNTSGSWRSSCQGNVGEVSTGLHPLLARKELGGHVARTGSLLKAQQLSQLK